MRQPKYVCDHSLTNEVPRAKASGASQGRDRGHRARPGRPDRAGPGDDGGGRVADRRHAGRAVPALPDQGGTLAGRCRACGRGAGNGVGGCIAPRRHPDRQVACTDFRTVRADRCHPCPSHAAVFARTERHQRKAARHLSRQAHDLPRPSGDGGRGRPTPARCAATSPQTMRRRC